MARQSAAGAGRPGSFPLSRAAHLALLVGAGGLLAGFIAIFLLPQRPDGDLTALAQFDSQHGAWALQDVRHSPWWNLAGALFAWGALDRLLAHGGSLWHAMGAARLARVGVLFWLGALLVWGGWAWNQSRGWRGELFLEPAVETPLGVDGAPRLTFRRFLIPPAPDGAGRALSMTVEVDGQAYDISEAAPFRGQGWTLTPRWYGATVTAPALTEPLFFGADGEQVATLRDGREVRIRVDVETLEATSVPAVRALSVQRHAILRAEFAPGDWLARSGLVLSLAALLLWLGGHTYNLWSARSPAGRAPRT